MALILRAFHTSGHDIYSRRRLRLKTRETPHSWYAIPFTDYLEKVIGIFLRAGKLKVLSLTGASIAVIAIADWSIGDVASLGVLYVVPMMMGAAVLTSVWTIFLAALCAGLKFWFDVPGSHLEMLLRFAFSFLAYATAGLFVIALIQNRKQAVEHLERIGREQDLRREAEEQLKTLVESSPAAVMTLDGSGVVLSANSAADTLFLIPATETLRGRRIAQFLPVLGDALKLAPGVDEFRTAAQCQARRSNGEIFMAHTWFSSYSTPEGRRLAAIAVDSSEEMREREEQGLQQLMRGNRIAAATVAHEVRNLCAAISTVCSNLQQRYAIQEDADLRGLGNLVHGLERIASAELQWRSHDELEEVELRDVLTDLQIVIETDWREIQGVVHWELPERIPQVLAEREGLLQAFLNLTRNSLKAVQDTAVRELRISVSHSGALASICFRDSGPGVSAPEKLFEPFQPGADGSGLGLYVSRAVLRSYGGELRHQPCASGTCFTVDLQVV